MKTSPLSTRRAFLHRGMAAGLVTAGAASLVKAETEKPALISRVKLTDTNAYLDQWPIRHLPLADQPAALAAKLKAQGVTEAWVSSLEALLHKDLASVNARLAEACAKHAIFKPIGAVNPMLPQWENDIERCAKLGMRGIRLHPNYHRYTLDDARFAEVIKAASAQKLVVQIAVVMEDDRTQPALWRVPPVNVATLPKALAAVPEAKVMLLNWQRSAGGKSTLTLLKETSVLHDIAMLEGIAGIEGLLTEMPAERIVFGSYAPVFYFESAKLKLQESALDEKQLNAITHGNAARFLGA